MHRAPGDGLNANLNSRWCFYINLPIGALVLAFLFRFVENVPPALGDLPLKEKISRIDIPGTMVFIPCIVCLLLALQWGGQKYAWSDGRIIALLVVFGVLLIAFIIIQIIRQESATLPPRIAKQRSIIGASWYAFFLGSSFFIVVYYISIWFQAIKGASAIRSGISTLPFILGLVVATISSGIAISKLGYYNPAIIAGGILTPIGAGLFTLFKVDTGHPMWIGVQVLYGIGVGVGLQQTNVAAQTVLNKKDAPTGVSFVFFCQGMGGAISVAVAQNILDNQLISDLSGIGNITPHEVANTGATDLRNVFTAEELPEVLRIYNHALVTVFYLAVGYACAALFGGLLLEWKSIKKPQTQVKKVDKEDDEANVPAASEPRIPENQEKAG